MTSLFEMTEREGAPVELVSRGVRGISLLEFLAVDEPAPGIAEEKARHEAHVAEDERETTMRVMIDAARLQAAAETKAALLAEFERQLQDERGRLAALMEQFDAERHNYFAEAEAEVVRLSLGIASQVLHREVKADALHLRATVRAALSRVSDGSASVLHVRPEQVEAWKAALESEGEARVSVAADCGLQEGDCVLATSVGRVAMGVATQLGEVELRFRHMLANGAMGSESSEEAR